MRTGPEDFDIHEREAQVSGDPRVTPMRPEDFTDAARKLVEETFAHVDAVDTSDVPEFFAISFKHLSFALSATKDMADDWRGAL